MSLRALVLSGGGARGAYEAGVITSLCKARPFDIVVGSSIGAFNAAVTAQRNVAALESAWKSVAARNLIQPLPSVRNVEAFLDAFSDWETLPATAKISHIPRLTLLWMQIGSKMALFSLLGAFDETPIETLLKQYVDYNALQSTLIVSTTDITTRTVTAFFAFVGAASTNLQLFRDVAGVPTEALSQINYVDVIRASVAIPAAFTPVQMNLGAPPPKFFVDGGVANNTPISFAIAAGAGEVTVVFLEPASNVAPSPPPRNLIDVAYACYDIMQQRLLEDDFRLAGYTNAMLANPTLPTLTPAMQSRLSGKRTIELYHVRPQSALPISILDFNDQAKLDAAFARGLIDGQNPRPF